MVNVGMVSLGCPKNQVDAEIMLAKIREAGYELVSEETQADVIIVNTCGFIEEAKRESIENILELAELKQSRLRALIVTGCMAERYRDEVKKEIPEVDVVLGIGANTEIVIADRHSTSAIPRAIIFFIDKFLSLTMIYLITISIFVNSCNSYLQKLPIFSENCFQFGCLFWWRQQNSNLRPLACQASTLTN